MKKNLSIVIKATQDFVRHTESDVKFNKPLLNSLFESISKIYIPLLRMFDKFEEEGLHAKLAMVLPPILCNLLSDEGIQSLYITWLEERIELGQKELKRNEGNSAVCAIINQTVDKNVKLRDAFENNYKKDLTKAFSEKVHKGYIELMGTSGTDIFMPHFADMKEIVSAQIECGLHSYRQFFDDIPEGFWLADLGYTPGVEKLIKAYGYSYTILDARALLLAEKTPENGIFYPVRTENSLAVFANDPDCYSDLFDEEEGFAENEVYRNEKRDIGFELSLEELQPVMGDTDTRFSTGYKYWNRAYEDDMSAENYYDAAVALEQAKKDAEAFASKKIELLNNAGEAVKEQEFVNLVCAFNADDLKNWDESMCWLENVLRNVSASDVNSSFCKQMLEKQYELEKIQPYFSAGNGYGYGENLLSNKNSWMMRYSRKASERMVDLSDRFPNDTGLKTRLLNLGAKELMLAQSLNLAKMIENEDYADLAIKRFTESIEAFTMVFDSLGSNTVSTEWLTTLEMKDSFFPWMNYRIFTKKR